MTEKENDPLYQLPSTPKLRTLTEDRKRAVDLIALKSWVEKFNSEKGKDPTRAEIWAFIQALNERHTISTETDLISLIEEEKEIREIAEDMCKVQGIPFHHIHIMLAPNPSSSFRVQGGTPSEIILGIRKKSPGFRSKLADAIRLAGKLYRSSSLIPMSKIKEYRDETKKLKTLPDDARDFFPLLDPSRIKVVEYRLLKIIDQKTNEEVDVIEEINTGMLKHYLNDRIAMRGRMQLSRNMLANGTFVPDNDDNEEDEDGNA